MIVVNKTLHLIFCKDACFNVGTNIFKKAPELSPVQDLIDRGDLLVVNESSEADGMEALRHSTSQETVEAVAKASKVKGGRIKEAAEKKAKEIADNEERIKKAIAEAKEKAKE